MLRRDVLKLVATAPLLPIIPNALYGQEKQTKNELEVFIDQCLNRIQQTVLGSSVMITLKISCNKNGTTAQIEVDGIVKIGNIELPGWSLVSGYLNVTGKQVNRSFQYMDDKLSLTNKIKRSQWKCWGSEFRISSVALSWEIA